MASERKPARARSDGRAKSRVYWLFVGAFLFAAVAVFYANLGVLQSLRYLVFDSYQRIAPAASISNSPVRIVDVDEASIARFGQWPWPRTTMARLTNALGALHAKAIVFDVMFSEPDRTSPEQMLQWVDPDQRSVLQNAIGGWPTHDALFADALAHNPTVLAATFEDGGPAETFPLKAGMVVSGSDPAPSLPSFSGFAGDLPSLIEAAHGIGSMNWVPDRDQVMRRVPLLFAQGGALAPSLALEGLRVAEGQTTYVVRSSNAHGSNGGGARPRVIQVRVGDHALATDATGAIWLHFRRSDRGAYISAARVLSGEVDAAQISGKIVLIGTSAPGLLDLRATPLDAAIPGVEVHQQAIEQMIANDYLTRPDFAPAIELLTAVLAVLVLAFAAPRLSASAGAFLGAAIIAAILLAGIGLFLSGGYLFDPIFPSACAALFASGSGLYLFQRTEQQRAEIRRAFGQYVSPGVVRQLAANPAALKLGGEVRDLSLLFCDVRNFTGISEGLSAEELTSFINSLLTPLSDIIIERGGTVDKYMGDSIMAFWNAPTDDSEHARHACEAAEQIVARMVDLNTQWRANAEAAGRSFAKVSIGIGVNSGECCVGNLGSERRFDYSAIGDNVNVTARLEGLTKILGLAFVAGEETVRRLPDMAFLEVDLIRLKGRSAPSRVFTLMSTIELGQGDHADLKNAHDSFIAAYRAAAWADARAQLAALQARDIKGLNALYAVYQERIAALESENAGDWDGVFTATTKA
jgi:adenylate cyclase